MVILVGVSAALFACNSPDRSVVVVDTQVPANSLAMAFGVKIESHEGTGFAVNGRIYTCEHVVHNATAISVTLRNGKIEKAKVTKSDDKIDLAELEIENMPPCLSLRSYAPRGFESVSQIGNPAGMRFIRVYGHFVTFNGWLNMFLIDTIPGNSGSPILDSNNQVIGMTHAIIEGSRFTCGGTLAGLRHFIYPNESI